MQTFYLSHLQKVWVVGLFVGMIIFPINIGILFTIK